MTAENEHTYYRSILNSQSFYIVRIDFHGNFLYANKAFEQVFDRYTQTPVIGSHWPTFLGLEDRKKMHDTIENCIKHPSHSFTLEIRCCVQNGCIENIKWEFVALESAEGTALEIQGIGCSTSIVPENSEVGSEQQEQQKELIRLYSALDMVPVSVIATDADVRIVYVNKAFEADTGYSYEEVIGKNPNFLGRFNKSKNEYVKMWRELNENGHFKGTFVNTTKTGETLFHETYISRLTLHGEVIGYVSSQHNISELVKRTKQYEELLNLFENTCRTAMVGGWEVELESERIRLTEIAKEIYEVENEYELDFQNSLQFFRNDNNKEIITNHFIKAIEFGENFDTVLEFTTKKGNEKYVRITGKAEFEGGQCTRLFGTIIDVTKQHETQVNLQRAHEELRCLIDYNPFAVFSLDREGHFTTANDETKKLSSIDPMSLIGKHFNEFVHSKDSSRAQEIFDSNLRSVRTVKELNTVDTFGNEHILKISGIPIIIGEEVEGVFCIAEDITEKVLAERELQRTQQILAAYFNSTADGIIIADKDYTIVAYNKVSNQNTEAVLGKPLYAGASLIDYTVASTIDDFKVDYELALQGQFRSIEFSLTEGGSLSWWRILYIPVDVPESNTPLVAFVAQNITDKKKDLEELREKEQLLEAYFNSTGEIIFIADENDQIVAFNKLAYDFSKSIFDVELSYSTSMKLFVDIIDEHNHDTYKKNAVNGNKAVFDKHIYYKDFEGWYNISYVCIKNRTSTENNYLLAYVISDISKRKELELELQDRNVLLERITSLSPVIIVVSEVDTGRIIFTGTSILKILGYPDSSIKYLENLPTSELNRFLMPNDAAALEEHLQECTFLKDGELRSFQFRVRNYFKTYEWVEIRTAVFKRNEKLFPREFIHSFAIVTDQVNMNIKLKELTDRLEERVVERTNDLLMTLETKNSLIELLSHDVRNKLGGIYLQGELLELHCQRMLPEKINTLGKSIKNLTNNITQLLDDVIETRRLDEGVFSMNKILIDVKDIILMAVSGVHAYALNKDIEIILEDPGGLVETDPNLAKEILENFISNAIKYSAEGTHVWVGSIPSEKEITIYVSDEGPGISPDDMNKLFVRFGKLSAKPTRGEHSTGLGLAITKQLAKMLNGFVWCESELGKGATFFASFPTKKYNDS